MILKITSKTKTGIDRHQTTRTLFLKTCLRQWNTTNHGTVRRKIKISWVLST